MKPTRDFRNYKPARRRCKCRCGCSQDGLGHHDGVPMCSNCQRDAAQNRWSSAHGAKQ